MTNEEFIKKIIDYYKESRLLTIDKGNHNIWRGVSHSISSKTEDLFAFFVAESINNNQFEYVVDKSFSLYCEGQKTIQFRPDLAIIINGVLTHILDLKMDMGYKRRFHETDEFKKLENQFNIFRAQNFQKVSYGEGKNVQVSKNIINQIVVISEKNEGKELNRREMIDEISKLDWAKIYYLTGSVHPNSYDVNVNEKIKINIDQFDALFNDIHKNIT